MDQVLTTASNVLLTGATGFIGGELLQRLEEETGGAIWSVVRARAGVDLRSRLTERYRRSGKDGDPAAHVHAVAGDVTLPEWGLDEDTLATVRRDADAIVHCAADTSFSPQHDTRATNVTSVRQLIALARQFKRNPLIVYISTASNMGQGAHCCVSEDQGCQPNNEHFNGYTQSKAEAEALLRASGLPVLYLRPTIVLSANLPDSGFAKQILWSVPLMYRFSALPLDADSRLDLVDIQFVVDAGLALMKKRDRRYDCYHLSAGTTSSLTMRQLREFLDGLYPKKQPVRMVPPSEWTVAEHRKTLRTHLLRMLFQSLRYYIPFLNMDVVYDDSRLRAELGKSAPSVRHPGEYLPALLRLIRTQAALQEAALP